MSDPQQNPYAPGPNPPGQPAPGPYVPVAALPPTPREAADRTRASLPLALTGVLSVAVVVNVVASSGFPGNAPVESIWSFGITIDLIAATLAVGIVGLVLLTRSTQPVPTPGIRPFAICAIIVGGAGFVAWFPLGGARFLVTLLTGERLRYYLDVNGAFFGGVLWVLGIVFGAIAFRRGAPLVHNLLALLAILFGLLIVAASLTSSIIYGLGLSD